MLSGFGDLSGRTKLRITGSDRIRFLNGQTTNDVRNATATRSQESCVLNAKGHLEAHLFLFAGPDAIWIDAHEELRDQIPARLERYIIADDVAITDATDEFALFHVLASNAPQLIQTRFCIETTRLSEAGWDLWIPSAHRAEAATILSQMCEPISADAWETLRVETGIPEWGRELTSATIPTEANLDSRAIDYNKGCYIGQEVISRIKTSGQTRQRLCGLVSTDVTRLEPGMTLYSGDKTVGRVTSTANSVRLNAGIALAFIKRGFYEPGTMLIARAEGGEARVRVTPMPIQGT